MLSIKSVRSVVMRVGFPVVEIALQQRGPRSEAGTHREALLIAPRMARITRMKCIEHRAFGVEHLEQKFSPQRHKGAVTVYDQYIQYYQYIRYSPVYSEPVPVCRRDPLPVVRCFPARRDSLTPPRIRVIRDIRGAPHPARKPIRFAIAGPRPRRAVCWRPY